MKPDLNSVIATLLQENANLTLRVAQYKSMLEQYQQAEEAEEG